MDALPPNVSDQADLDTLMVRVREAAMTSGTGAGGQVAGDVNGAGIDLADVLDAQAEWNEHTSQSLAVLVDCLRTLRDGWTDAEAELRREIGRLSGLVEQLRAAASPRVVPPSPSGGTLPRTHRPPASQRGAVKRRPAGKGRPRS
jgi:hypothetical protein